MDMGLVPRKTNLRLAVRRPSVLLRKYWPALLVLLIGSVADAATTYDLMRQYGPEGEMHPVQRWMAGVMGTAMAAPLAKAMQTGIAVLIALWWRKWTAWLMLICGLLYGLAACSNYFMWF